MDNGRVPTLSSSSLLSSTLPPNSLFSLFTSLSASKEQHQYTQGIPSQLSTSASSLGATAPLLDNKEDERECSHIIMEIDKGIRSSNLGDQVESIMFYSQLIKYHPTSMVVNSIIIKLADIFRNCSNLVRYRILKVFQECSAEIHRLSSIDEVLKRIHSVTLSNDILARAIALRVLGSVPHLIADKLYVHHTIRTTMQTHDQVEADANYFVMDRLCEVSPVFSDSIIEKIHTIIQAIETPPLTKLKYTRLFRHMHHNHLISNQSRTMLIGLLDLYPSVVQVTLILDTLNTLALKHRLYVNEHITFLINYISKDPRIKVKLTGLKCLQRLAKSSPHSIFPFKEIFELLKENHHYSNLFRYHCLLLLSYLSSIQYNYILEDKQYLSLLFEYCLHPVQLLSEQSVEILSNLLLEINENDNQDLIKQYVETICNIISNITNISSATNDHTSSSFKDSKLLKSIINFLRHFPKYSEVVTTTIVGLFGKVSNETMRCLMHCVSIYIPYCKSSIHSHFKTLLIQLGTIIENITTSDSKLIMSIFITIFRSYDEYIEQIPKITECLLPFIEQLVITPNYQWCCYQLAKQSQRHGFHLIAKIIYSKLITSLDTESNYFWLQSLLSISSLEHSISSGESITPLLADFNTTVLSFKASCIHEKSIIFQQHFIEQREQYLYNLLNVKLFLIQYCTSLDLSSRVNLMFSKKLLSFQNLAKQYSQILPKLVFNSHIDNMQLRESKSILETYSISCNLIVYFLTITFNQNEDPNTPQNNHQNDNLFRSTSDSFIERFPLYKICKYLFQQFQLLQQEQQQPSKSIAFLCDTIDMLISIPANYPSQFFTQIY